jgi:Xaa-Pro dipeptidase
VATPEQKATGVERAFERLAPALRAEVPPPFPKDEYEDRWRRVRAAMEANGVDVLYVSDPADLCYLTGYQLAWYQDGGPAEWIAATGLALHVDHDAPIFFDTADERLIAAATAEVPDLRIYAHAEPEHHFDDPTGFEYLTGFIVGTLKAEGWLSGTAGLQNWRYRPARGYSEVFQAALEASGARVRDATSILSNVRRRKSARELEVAREAARLGDIAMEAARDAIAAGVSELEIWAAMTSAMARDGGELSAIPGMVNSGPKCASLHGVASRRRLAHGDLVNIDMCGVRDRYHSNVLRMFALGEPPPALQEEIAKVPALYRAATAEFRPGMPFREILAIDERIARELGIWEDRWWVGGYDLGIAFAPDWVGDPYFSSGEDPGDKTLDPGTMMNHEFNFYLPDGSGIRGLIDTMIVTEDRVEFPHRFPIDLTVVD